MVAGIVENVYVGPAKEGKGGRTYHQIGVTIGGVRYGAFSNSANPPCAKGDRVEINATKSEDGKHWNFDGAKGIRIVERGAVPTTTSTGGTSTAGKASGGQGGNREECIVRQNALAHATNLVIALTPKRDVGTPALVDQVNASAELIVAIAAKYFVPFSLEGVVAGRAVKTTAAPTETAEQKDDTDVPY